MRTVQTITATIVAGILSGFLFIGIGGRAAMKAIGFVAGRDLSFTIEGTLATLVFSTSVGVAGGVLFRILHRHLPGSSSAKGGSFGLLLLVVLIPLLPDAVREEAIALGDHIPLAITIFGLLLVGFGVVLEAMARTLIEISCGRISQGTVYSPTGVSSLHSIQQSLTNQEYSMRTLPVLVITSILATTLLNEGFAQKKSAALGKLIERGKYLVNLGGCNDCHTPKKFGPKGMELDESRLLSGSPAQEPVPAVPDDVIGMEPDKWMALTDAHLAAWAGPWGVSFAANLTPDVETGLGSWSETMFIKAMRTGKHMGEGRPILPPMPWENFAKLDDKDLKAMFAYLGSLPAVKNAVREPIPPKGQ